MIIIPTIRLYKKPHEIILNGIGGDQRSRHYVELTLFSTWDDSSDDYITVKCHVVDSLLSNSECSDANRIRNMTLVQSHQPLADPAFGRASHIDLLLGIGDVYRAYREGKDVSADGSIRMDNTLFGWTVSGQIQDSSSDLPS